MIEPYTESVENIQEGENANNFRNKTSRKKGRGLDSGSKERMIILFKELNIQAKEQGKIQDLRRLKYFSVAGDKENR